MKRLAQALILSLIAVSLRVTYRLRTRALTHIPTDGAAVLVANHITFIDALVLAALSPRRLRFVMDHRYMHHWLVGPISRLFGVIPIASRRENPALLDAAMDTIDATLAGGGLVAIFPEGRLTRDGEVGAFRPGIERILARRPVPVVPMALQGLWGSRFSRAQARFGRLRRPVALVCGPALHPETSANTLREQVLALRGSVV